MRGGELVLHAFGWRHTMGECEATGARQRDTKHKVMRERDWEPPLFYHPTTMSSSSSFLLLSLPLVWKYGSVGSCHDNYVLLPRAKLGGGGVRQAEKEGLKRGNKEQGFLSPRPAPFSQPVGTSPPQQKSRKHSQRRL